MQILAEHRGVQKEALGEQKSRTFEDSVLRSLSDLGARLGSIENKLYELHAMKRADSDMCPLDGQRHTVEHLLWDCTAFAKMRRPYTRQIGKIMGQAVHAGASVAVYISEILDSVQFRKTGLVQADPMAANFAKERHKQLVLAPPSVCRNAAQVRRL